MNIEVGKAYRTRSGKKVVIHCNDRAGCYKVGGDVPGYEEPQCWTITGKYEFGKQHPLDLISEWIEPVELKIEAGKFYRYRNGGKCLVPYINPDGSFASFPINKYGEMELEGFCHDGKNGGNLYENDDDEEDEDIIGPWIDPPKPLEFWINIYPPSISAGVTYNAVAHTDKQHAMECRNRDIIRTALFREVIE